VQKKSPHFLVGIDLGTTHTVVAYAKTDQKNHDIKLFKIEQLLAPGEIAARKLLPSVRYHPAKDELATTDTTFSPTGKMAIIGEAARLLGAKSQGRMVTSAKSWLSHPSIDHSAAILPWGSPDEVLKVSPIDASASYLAHVRTVWNHQFPNALLENQEIVLTVPASFDEAARSLTLQAAQIAGLSKLRLLEEPQAVCYDWLRRHQQNLQQELKDVHLLLVCDVGGGTTDLTLIKVEPGEPEPKLTRIGVGDHLMLGGDNIDLALAHLVEQRLNPDGQRLSAADLSQLIEQCRICKEELLSDNAPEQYTVTLLGGGSKLIGGARSVELSKDEVRTIALDGFFLLSNLDELPDKKRSGVVEFGLPYAAEPAVSKHIAAFLHLHHQAAQQATGNEKGIPDAILLNGGVFRSQIITKRTLDLISSWSSEPVAHLENIHPELAVAYGAVSYAIARRGKQIKIGGGAARSYFLLIDTENQKSQQAICILPQGSDEGEEIILKERQFALRLGQPVRFHLASLTGDNSSKSGDLINNIDDRFHSLPPLAVALEQDNEANQADVIVQLAITLTEVGTLQIQCIAIDKPQQRWDVEFQIRRKKNTHLREGLPANFSSAADKIQLIFGGKSKTINPKAVKSLRADLEKILGPRTEWQTSLLRELFSLLLENMKNRRRSANHERIWFSLTGFCLRPGFGYQLDNWRVEQLWKSYPHNIQYVNETQNWTEWWTLWRRTAGGMDTTMQEKIFSDLEKFLNPASARQGSIAKQGKIRGYDDMVRLSAVLERLPVKKKIKLGNWLLKRLQKASESKQTWWAIGRIGARILFHGSDHFVIPPEVIETWIKQTLTTDWEKTPQIGFAATLMTRMSGDRSRDINSELRQQVVEKLTLSKAPAPWLQMVTEVKELSEQEEKQVFGEALPPGLKLINNT
jgi:molecular chaperone DnaK (HSP70)